ncbi:extracellular solute-binding protein [Thermobifida halotolerans]|uniref:extracellular solute-binding protein n=1 Tax=Thermobifida halotolerans TaxID=483545 RepID=UPI000AB0CF3F|nr:extracellular solute-binding protein [Thermobifida halotolerans]
MTAAALTAGALLLTACGSGFDDGSGGGGELTSEDTALTVLIGSSGDSETQAVRDAVAAWSEESGTEAEVIAANDLTQQLSQGFASGEPADVFYLSSDHLAGYADNGSLLAYGDMLEDPDAFYPTLVQNFTYKDEFYCAPKDFSTLALVINNRLWEEAGLTDNDVPATWDELADVANRLTTDGRVGLTFSAEYQRIGVFMAQAGGGLVNEGGTEAIADSEENVEALEFVQQMINDGSLAFAPELGAGWGGEAFGKELAAMTIEGNWIVGAMTADHPEVDYRVVELPAGPAGQGTLQFTNCWGIAADSPNQQGALDLVEYLTSADAQLGFSEAFGAMPSIEAAAADWNTANPELAAFLAGADYASGVPTVDGAAEVISDFNAQVEQLGSADIPALLDQVQSNLEAIVG